MFGVDAAKEWVLLLIAKRFEGVEGNPCIRTDVACGNRPQQRPTLNCFEWFYVDVSQGEHPV